MHPRVLLTLWLCVLPALAFGQDTRAGQIAAQQAEKARRLAPRKAPWAESVLLSVRKTLVETPSGFYPYLASVYSGGGFTLGAGLRQYTGDQTHVSIAGLYSAKSYKLVEVAASSPGHLSDHLDLHAIASWRDATQVAYHGLGIESPELDTGYRMQQMFVGGDLTARPLRFVRLMGAVSFEDYTLKDPTGSLTPVDDVFTPVTAPGLGVNPQYVHTFTSAAFDWRPGEYARRGGLYSIAHHNYSDRDDTFSFSRLDAEAVQHIPVLRENWVFSMRARLETTLDDDDQVPFFMLPSLGSGSTLRGYSSWRFRDRHSMLLSGEWRWIPNRMAIDMALFYDAGMVAPRFDAITLKSFKSDVGIGFRVHAPAKTVLRVELAKGSEGWRTVWSSGAAF